MILNDGKKEVTLDFSTAAYMTLKAELKTDNLRKALLADCNKENYETLARGIKVFSGAKIAAVKDAYPYIDCYCKDNEVRKTEMFMQFIVELGENGFFGESKTLEEIQAMAASPEMEIDMGELTDEAMKMFKGEMLHKMVANIAQDSSTTGANTSTTSAPQLTVVE